MHSSERKNLIVLTGTDEDRATEEGRFGQSQQPEEASPAGEWRDGADERHRKETTRSNEPKVHRAYTAEQRRAADQSFSSSDVRMSL